MLVVLLDIGKLKAQTFQCVTVRTSWRISAVDSCLLVFCVMEAVFKILMWGRIYCRNPWNDLDFFIVVISLVDFTLSLVQSAGGFSNRQASTLFWVLKTLKGARVFRALRLLKAICLAVLVDNFQLSICKKRQCKTQKSPDVKEGETQSTEKVEEVLEMSQSEIEEELYKEALRHASSESKHSKRKIELITRRLQLLAAMDQHM
ncbi:hypothetical protein AOLI_G00291330 [Acnodon oligacanthus]